MKYNYFKKEKKMTDLFLGIFIGIQLGIVIGVIIGVLSFGGKNNE